MARVGMRMSAPPFGAWCAGCGRAFENREVMAGVEYDDRDPAGWFCCTCIETWKRTGKPPEKGSKQ